MAINTSIQNLINTNRKLTDTDVNNLFHYYYGRRATTAELNYWGNKGNKTSTQLSSALTPNAKQFTNTGYYKDVITPTTPAPTTPAPTTPAPTTPAPTTPAPTTPAPTTPAPTTPTTPTPVQTPITNKQDIINNFNKYLGRAPSEVEITKYQQLPPTTLENDLKLQYKRITGNDYGAAQTPDTTSDVTPEIEADVPVTEPIVDESTATYDPFEEAMKYGYTREDLVSDPNFAEYWSQKTPEQLKAGLAMRSDWDAGIGKKKIAGSETLDGTPETPDDTPAANMPYGTERLSSDVETWTGQFIGTILTTLKRSGGIDENSYNTIVNNPEIIGKYIKALLYGDYTMDDIYRDIKIQDLAAQGNTNYSNLKGIDENVKADAFYNSNIGQQVKNDNFLAPSLGMSGMDAELFNNPIFKIPGQAFSTIVKPIDWNSPEFKEEAEKIQASYYDILNQNYEASTDQQKAVAKSNWENFQKNLQDKYNISLSNNVRSAWGQLEELFSTSTEAGIGKSGLVNEAMDKYLTDIRRNQDILRTDTSDKKDIERRNYLMQSGTPEEIAIYINEIGAEKAAQYGFAPSTETKAWYTKENLKNLYPDMSDSEINNVIGMMVDESGNYKSKLYQTLSANKYDIGQQKTTYQQGKLYEQKLAEEEKAYAPFTTSNPLSSYQPEYKEASDVAGSLGSFPSPAAGITGKSVPPFGNPAYQKTNVPSSTSGSITQDSTANMKPFTDWTSGKTDALGKNWQGYSALTSTDLAGKTAEQKKLMNIQNIGTGTLYGYKS